MLYTAAPDPVLFNVDLVALYDRMLDADCDEDCDLDCVATVTETERWEAYDKFRDVVEARVAHNLYLCKCIELKQRTVDVEDNIIEETTEFWLDDKMKVKVCKTFFTRTLGLPDARLNALLEPDTFEWFSRYKHLLIDHTVTVMAVTAVDNHDRDVDEERTKRYCGIEQPCSEFVLNSRKYLEKNSLSFVKETDSDLDEDSEDIVPSVFNSVVNQIQSIPRVVSTLINPENDKEVLRFESSINYKYMYLHYLKQSKKNKNKLSEKQYKKIYNQYMKKIFMVK
ncbi:uncharacterized protein LOC112687829 [Sipha flava]|uniref:Uncharacterized protein LOC112687827 n=3 Tax=Sipha flava TaxID=143950 RepID=A0A8B8G1T4_9HEMI|nr:uncharacterized protein LOC112687827 [Sipha flava]XP_025416562.1 uncharacterized protein LOC112687829 [Sipha flava]